MEAYIIITCYYIIRCLDFRCMWHIYVCMCVCVCMYKCTPLFIFIYSSIMSSCPHVLCPYLCLLGSNLAAYLVYIVHLFIFKHSWIVARDIAGLFNSWLNKVRNYYDLNIDKWLLYKLNILVYLAKINSIIRYLA